MASASAKKAVPAKKAATTKKAVPVKKAVPIKKTAVKAPATAKKAPAKAAPARPPAKKATATKPVAPAKKPPAKPVTPAKTATKAPVKKAVAPAKAALAKAAPAKAAPAKAAPAKAAPAKAAPAKAAPAKGANGTVATKKPTTAKGKLVVREDESPWTAAEIAAVRKELEADVDRLLKEIAATEADIADLVSDSGEGAGDDQADAGSKTFEREHEMSLANNARDMLLQTEHALHRIDNKTYGICESCGRPVGKLRLQAFPRATMCLSCKQIDERRAL